MRFNTLLGLAQSRHFAIENAARARSEPPIGFKLTARAPSLPPIALENAARARSELPVRSKTLLELARSRFCCDRQRCPNMLGATFALEIASLLGLARPRPCARKKSAKNLFESTIWVKLCSGSHRAVVLCTLQCTGSLCFQKCCSESLFESAARNHRSKSLFEVNGLVSLG